MTQPIDDDAIKVAARAGFEVMMAETIRRFELECPLVWDSEHVSELCRQDWLAAAREIVAVYEKNKQLGAGNKP